MRKKWLSLILAALLALSCASALASAETDAIIDEYNANLPEYLSYVGVYDDKIDEMEELFHLEYDEGRSEATGLDTYSNQFCSIGFIDPDAEDPLSSFFYYIYTDDSDLVLMVFKPFLVYAFMEHSGMSVDEANEILGWLREGHFQNNTARFGDYSAVYQQQDGGTIVGFNLVGPSSSGASNNASSGASTSGATPRELEALDRAGSYLRSSAFSYPGLIDQLEYEGFTESEATYAADHCGADWYEQAEKSAQSYLRVSAFSYTGLIDQLEYEGFTEDQATRAVDNCGADWNEQAAKSAQSYLKYSSFTRQELIEQLEYEGFTHAQAVYGVSQNGM